MSWIPHHRSTDNPPSPPPTPADYVILGFGYVILRKENLLAVPYPEFVLRLVPPREEGGVMRIRKLNREGIDIELSTSRNVTVRILERPGRWMSPQALQDLLDRLRVVAWRGTDGKGLDYGVLSGDRERMANAVITLISDATTGNALGFSAMSLLPVTVRGRDHTVLHLGLVMLDPRLRGRGCARLVYGMSLVIRLLRRGLRSFWVSNVTQVPAVVGMVSETLVDAYPNAQAERGRTPRHVAMAREIMSRHRAAFGVGGEASFDSHDFIIRNAYTGGSDHLKKSYDEAPKHRNPAFNELCRARLDYDRGDDFLQLARVTPLGAARCVARFALESSSAAPVVRRLLNAFGRLSPTTGSASFPLSPARRGLS